jgi:predicted aminopeptidase
MVTEARRAYNQAYYLAHREQCLARSKARYLADPEAWARKTEEARQRLRLFLETRKRLEGLEAQPGEQWWHEVILDVQP